MHSATTSDKLVANAVLEELCHEPYNLAFAIYMKKRKRRDLERDFCGVLTKDRAKEAFKACNHHIGYFYLYQIFGQELSSIEAEALQIVF